MGQMVFLFCGPAGTALAMMGRGYINFMLGLASIVLITIIGPFVTQSHGLYGLAITVSTLIGSKHLLSLFALRREVRRWEQKMADR